MTTIPSSVISTLVLSHFVLELHSQRKTGIAFFEHETTRRQIYFKEGDVVFAASNRDEDSLGECLLREKKITKSHHDVLKEIIQKTKKQHSAVLLELGFIRPDDLLEGLKLQIRHIFSSLFSWREGQYRFEGGTLPAADIMTVPMNPVQLIIDALRRLDWKAVRKSLPPLNTILNPPDGSGALHPDNLSPDHKTVLSLIDGKRSMEEICSLSGVGDFNTLSAIHLFLSLRMVQPGKVKPAEAAAPAQKASRAAEHRKPKHPGAETPLTEVQMIRQAFDELEGQNHYQVLKVTEQATEQEIKKSYFRLAKLYHPDRYHAQDSKDMKPMLEKLFASITEAYNALSTQVKRDEYDLSRARARKTIHDDDKSERSGAALAQFNKGMKEFKGGNFWGALDAFTWAIRLDDTNAKYVIYQALALSNMPRRIHEAEEVFKKAIAMEPTNPEFRVEFGNFYLKMKLNARARAEFKKALEWDPDSVKAKQGMLAAGEENKD